MTGFVLSTRDGKQVWSDEQVVGLSHSARSNFLDLQRQYIVLEVRDGEHARRIDCVYLPPRMEDPFAGFWDRLKTNLARRIVAGLSEGERLQGDGWQVDARGLHTRTGSCPHFRIAMTCWLGGRLHVWRDLDERPFLRLPFGSRNVLVLAEVLKSTLADRPAAPIPGKPLGRIMLERRCGDWKTGLWVLAVLVPFASMFVALAIEEPFALASAPLLLAFGIGLIAIAWGGFLVWRGLTQRLTFHEHGVCQPHWGKTIGLRWDEVGAVACRNQASLDVLALPQVNRPSIRYRCLAGSADEDFTAMRDWLCCLIAYRWREQLARAPIQWTWALRFLPDRLEYREGDPTDEGAAHAIPYTEVRYRVGRRFFHLSRGDDPRVLLKQRIDEPNFFVGLMLLRLVYQQHGRETPEPVPGPRAFPRLDPNAGIQQPGGITS